MKTISSPQNSRFRQALRLHSSRGRKQQGRMIIFGLREIERAIEAGVDVDEIYLVADLQQRGEQLSRRLPQVQLICISDTMMQQLQFGQRGDGMVAIAVRPPTDLHDFPVDRSLVLVLEKIEKPGNLGAIMRSIDAVGAGGLILSQPQCDVFHPNAIRTSTGVNFSLPIATATNAQTRQWLQQHRYCVLTAQLDDAVDFFSIELPDRLAIVLGSEAFGLSAAWQQQSYQAVKLPMAGKADSLNVSVTASVMLYETRRQQNAKRIS